MLNATEGAGGGARTKNAAVVPRSRAVEVDDPSGFFRVENVEPGGYFVELKSDGLAPTRARDVFVQPDVDVDLGALVLRSGGVVYGRVVDDRGASVPEADVLLARVGGGPIPAPDPVKTRTGTTYDASFAGTTDADGRFRIPAIAQGQYLLRVDSASHLPYTPVQLVIVDGEEQSVSVELKRAGSVTLTCVDDSGAPLQHCLVELRDLDGRLVPPGKGTERVTRTNGFGVCELPRVPLGTLIVRGRVPGWVSQDVSIVVKEGEPQALTIKLQKDTR
jgi:hypothetical protein